MLFILGFLKSSSSLIAESEETLVFFIYYVCGILRLDIYIFISGEGGLTSSLFIMTAIWNAVNRTARWRIILIEFISILFCGFCFPVPDGDK